MSISLIYVETDECLRMTSEYLQNQLKTIFDGKFELELRAMTSSARYDVMKESRTKPVSSWELGWSAWGLAAEYFYPWKKYERYLSTYTSRHTEYKNSALDAIYAQCLLEENRLDDEKLLQLTVQGEEAMYEDMTYVPVFCNGKFDLYQEEVDLPMTQYSNQIGFGWMYATKK